MAEKSTLRKRGGENKGESNRKKERQDTFFQKKTAAQRLLRFRLAFIIMYGEKNTARYVCGSFMRDNMILR